MMGRQNSTRAGRWRGRSSRGHGTKGNKSTSKKPEVTNVSKLLFQVGTAKQASHFVKIKKYCINSMMKEFNQGYCIAIALEQGKDYDFTAEEPTMETLEVETGTQEAKLLTRTQNEMKKVKYRNQSAKHDEKVQTFSENKFKAYSYLWNKCSTTMKQNIEAKADFTSKIKKIRLWVLRVPMNSSNLHVTFSWMQAFCTANLNAYLIPLCVDVLCCTRMLHFDKGFVIEIIMSSSNTLSV